MDSIEGLFLKKTEDGNKSQIYRSDIYDPGYSKQCIRSDNICCTLLAQSAVHGAMVGYTGSIVGLVNGRYTYIPFHVPVKNWVVLGYIGCTSIFVLL
ncbi:ATP-dependent 6-phosphofructokinase 1-like [Magnolia sinica]|uniref:ATP-dependent 6-phosphofructokinase 1-like n=1 Tax=Magnolia sinica TaxID=86752 RepID=UPI0026596C0A|nr:ATP-dependent 6-phosphofructokinase 1-like [Magnolia sinica]